MATARRPPANPPPEGLCRLVMTSSFCAGGRWQCCELLQATATALPTGRVSYWF